MMGVPMPSCSITQGSPASFSSSSNISTCSRQTKRMCNNRTAAPSPNLSIAIAVETFSLAMFSHPRRFSSSSSSRELRQPCRVRRHLRPLFRHNTCSRCLRASRSTMRTFEVVAAKQSLTCTRITWIGYSSSRCSSSPI